MLQYKTPTFFAPIPAQNYFELKSGWVYKWFVRTWLSLVWERARVVGGQIYSGGDVTALALHPIPKVHGQ